MNLLDYQPNSEAVVKKTIIKKAKFKVFDIHVHMGKLLLGDDYYNKYDTSRFLNELNEVNVVRINNLDGFYGKDLDIMSKKVEGHNNISSFMWIDFEGINNEEYIKSNIMESYKKGCRGIKLWKDISLYKKIRMDDCRLNVIYETAAYLNIPVLMHIADSVAFFKKVDRYNERYEELIENPDWQFYDRTKYFDFYELIKMQENVIKAHPNTKFIVAHVGSYSENLGWVSNQLKKYKNMYVDISARISELGRVPYSSRKFFNEFKDRILFGSDVTPFSIETYFPMFRFLETDDEYFNYCEDEKPNQGRFYIYGINLNDDILKNVYYKNACKLMGIDEKEFE